MPTEPSKWALGEAERWHYRHDNPVAVAAGLTPAPSRESVSSLAALLDAARAGEQQLRSRIEAAAKNADQYAKLLIERADIAKEAGERRESRANVAAAGEHEHAARVLRGVLLTEHNAETTKEQSADAV